MVGYIKLHRQMLQWEWYTDINTKTLFLHCLLMANHKDNEWRGIKIERGSFVTSLRKMSVEIGLTVSQIRTSLDKLKSTQEIAYIPHTHNTTIKVLNYAEYQGYEKDTIAHKTHKTSQSNRTQNSTKQEYKEIKNDKNIKDKEIIKEKIVYFANADLEDLFQDFLNVRKKLKAVNSDRAITTLLNKLEELSSGDIEIKKNILEQSIMNSWKGVFPIKQQNGFKSKQQSIDERKAEQFRLLAKELNNE